MSGIPTVTSFQGPFPTDFKVPSDCTGIAGGNIFRYDFDPTCLPEDFDPEPTAIYSPGTACPTGYTAQDRCQLTDGATTTLICCPHRGDLELSCVDDLSTLSYDFTSLWCTWSAGTHKTVLLATDRDETIGVTFTGFEGVNAYGIKMVYESTDVGKKTKSSTARATKTGTTATDTTETAAGESTAIGGTGTGEDTAGLGTAGPGTAAPQPQETGGNESPQGSGGIATAAIVGVAIAIPLICIAMAIGVFLWYRKRKLSKVAAEAAAAPKPPMSEAPGSAFPGSTYPGSAASPSTTYSSHHHGGPSSAGTPYSLHPPYDLHAGYFPNGAGAPPQEMPAQTFVSELPGDSSMSHTPKYR